MDATGHQPVVVVDSEWDDRNPAFGEMPDGTLLLAYAEMHTYRRDGAFDWNAGPSLTFYVRSSDSGKTWSQKHIISTPWPKRIAIRQTSGLQERYGITESVSNT